MTLTRSVVRIMDLVLWMIIVVMGIFVWMGFVRGLDEIGKGKERVRVRVRVPVGGGFVMHV
jgi:hypothetical protein